MEHSADRPQIPFQENFMYTRLQLIETSQTQIHSCGFSRIVEEYLRKWLETKN